MICGKVKVSYQCLLKKSAHTQTAADDDDVDVLLNVMHVTASLFVFVH